MSGRYIARRILSSAGSTLALITLIFLALRITGDPAAALLPQEATAADVVQMRKNLGLDQPLPVQYVRFLGGLFTGDLGTSFKLKVPVAQALKSIRRLRCDARRKSAGSSSTRWRGRATPPHERAVMP